MTPAAPGSAAMPTTTNTPTAMMPTTKVPTTTSPTGTTNATGAVTSTGSTSTGSTSTGGVAGANSFTEGQAKSRLEKEGYTAVSGLKKDADGIWRGTAMKNEKSVSVSVDYKGNISGG